MTVDSREFSVALLAVAVALCYQNIIPASVSRRYVTFFSTRRVCKQTWNSLISLSNVRGPWVSCSGFADCGNHNMTLISQVTVTPVSLIRRFLQRVLETL